MTIGVILYAISAITAFCYTSLISDIRSILSEIYASLWTRDKCVLCYHVTIQCVFSMDNLFLVKCCIFSQKCDKGVTELFFSLPTENILSFFLGWVRKRYVKITSFMSILFQKCINWSYFLKNGNFGTHAIVVIFLCFLHKTLISFWWYIAVR